MTVMTSSEQLANQDVAIGQVSIGLVSMDDLISELNIHPYAAAYVAELAQDSQQSLLKRCQGNPAEFFVSTLSEHLVQAGQLAGEQPLRVRLSGADSSHRQALPGAELEPKEAYPLIGLRGVSRFADHTFRKAFELECEAIKRARLSAGMKNIELVIPFVRTFSEAATVMDLLAEQGLSRGSDGLKVHLMAELPANALTAETFLHYFDGLIIDVDQLARFALGVDFDHPALAYLHDDQNEAVLQLVAQSLRAARKAGKPAEVLSHFISKAPNLQQWLLEQGMTRVIAY